MQAKTFFAAAVFSFIFTVPVSAATLIESRTEDGSRHKIWIEGNWLRIDVSSESAYVLVDTVAAKMYSVDPAAREILDLGSYARQREKSATAKKIAIQFEEKGSGPEIAGYQTTHFLFAVNGRKCRDEFLSRQAMDDIASFEMMQKMDEMASFGIESIPENMIDPCDLAQLQLDDYYQRHGFPLRIINKWGAVETEVMRIDRQATPPQPGFSLPKGFKLVQMEKRLEEEMRQEGGRLEEPVMPPAGVLSPELNNEELQRLLQEMMKRQGGE